MGGGGDSRAAETTDRQSIKRVRVAENWNFGIRGFMFWFRK